MHALSDADTFYAAKGVAALVATLLLIFHMERAWRESLTIGRRLRYLALLYFAATLTYKSVSQVQGSDPVDIFALLGMGGALLLLAAAVLSISETR